MSTYPIHDLHADLLCYLAGDPARTPNDPVVRCSISDLQKGGVVFQVLPVFVETAPGSSQRGEKQVEIFRELKKTFPKEIQIELAIENASSFAEENEPLDAALERLERIGTVFYISLTWNFENRFGGGALTSIGIKEDGKALLQFLDKKGIAVDLSHASDALAYGILDYIDAQALDVPVIASHSNFRKVCDVPRNLPDELALEIIRRKGLIGINFVQQFVGTSFVKHLEHGLKLGGENTLCFGADFFYEDDIPAAHRRKSDYFFKDYGNSSVYPRLIANFDLPASVIEKIVKKNVMQYISLNSSFVL